MWRDSETNVDLLDFDYLVDVAKNIIMNNDLTPSTIGIYGDWGSGKSSLMDMLKVELEKQEDVLCLKFNGWLFEGYEDAKVALVGTILDEISSKRKLSAKAKGVLKNLYDNTDFIKLSGKLIKYGLDFFLTGGTITASDLSLGVIKNALADKGTQVTEDEIAGVLKALKGNEVRKSIKTFHADFESLLKETKLKRLVVFIDELDRCKHETILETLEAIRLFLFATGTSFVIGADERQIRYAVQMKYPDAESNQLDVGKEYLEKMIQYPIRIPQLGQKEVEFYIMCLLFEKELEKKDLITVHSVIYEAKKKGFLDFELSYELIKEKSTTLADRLKNTISLSKQISSVLARGLNGNPRHCKRFLNAMELRLQMANYRGMSLDRNILSKIMLIEYFRDTFYKRVAEIQAKDNGKPKELEHIENNKWDDVKDLSLWKDDTWIIEWINIDTKIANVDLRPYFYFSRESIKNASFHKQKNLSKEGASVLEKLLSSGDSARNEAIKLALSVTEYEASIILIELVSKIESSADVDKSLFQSFIEWGCARTELFVETLAVLDRLPATKLKASFIPLIANFANKLTNNSRVKELFSKWPMENVKLKNAIENELKNIK